jgi:hypothetical protein
MTNARRRSLHAVSSVNIAYSCQYMENHRGVSVMGAQSQLGAATTSEGQPLLFAFDSENNFHATVSADGGQTPWSDYPIATEVIASYGSAGAAAKSFAVSQEQDGGPVSLLLTVTPSGAPEELWILAGMDSSPAAPWLKSAEQRNWSKISAADAISGPLNIADLRAMPQTASGQGGYYVAHNAERGTYQPFSISLGEDGSGASVAPIVPPENYVQLIDLAAGMPNSAFNPGLYTLFAQKAGGAATLMFRSDDGTVVPFGVSAAASAVAVLPYVDEGAMVTDLFVADVVGEAPAILYFNANQTPGADGFVQPTMTIPLPTWASPVSEIHVATDGYVVSLWGRAGGYVFHIQAPFGSGAYGNPGSWSQPVPLLANVTAMGIHISAQRGLTSLFAVQQQSDSYAGLIEFHKDQFTTTGHWRKRKLLLPASREYETLQTYTHRLAFTDENNMAMGNTQVAVTSTATVILEINGVMVTVPGQAANVSTGAGPVMVSTDTAGLLDIMQVTASPASPVVTFTLNGQSQSIDPTVNTRAAMVAQLTPTGPNNTPPVASQTWYSTNNMSSAQVGQAVGVINDNTPTSATALSGGHIVTSLDLSIDTFMGDVWNAICEGFDDLVSIAVEAGELLISIGDLVITAVIKTYEDVAAALSAIIAAIGAALTDLFNLIAFLFDWGNIIAIQQQILGFNQQLLTAAPTLFAGVGNCLGQWLAYLGDKIADPSSSTGLPASGVQSTNASATNAQTAPGPNQPASTDPRLSWGQKQVPPPASPSASAPAPRADAPQDSSDPLTDFVTDCGDFILAVGEDIGGLADGSTSLSGFAEGLRSSAGDLATNLSTLVGTVGDDGSEIMQSVTTMLNQGIDIPLFTCLYDHFFKEQLTPLALVSLLQAVPATFVYTMTGPSPVVAANFMPSTSATQNIFNILPTLLPNPPSATTPHPHLSDEGRANLKALRAGLGDGEPIGYCAFARILVGILHVFRAGSTFAVEGLADALDEPTPVVPGPLFPLILQDTIIWIGEALILSYIAVVEEEDGVVDTLPLMNLATSVVMLLVQQQPSTPPTVAQAEGILTAMSIASGILGSWEIGGGISGIAAGGSVSVADGIGGTLYGMNELLEFGCLLGAPAEELKADILVTRIGLMAASAAACIIAGGLSYGNTEQ